jgi:hypothetical protein
MTKKYSVGAYKKYETVHGTVVEEQVKFVDAGSSSKAEKVAEELFKEGGYDSIYISFAHHDSSCYYNPAVGMESVGKDWIEHFEHKSIFEEKESV